MVGKLAGFAASVAAQAALAKGPKPAAASGPAEPLPRADPWAAFTAATAAAAAAGGGATQVWLSEPVDFKGRAGRLDQRSAATAQVAAPPLGVSAAPRRRFSGRGPAQKRFRADTWNWGQRAFLDFAIKPECCTAWQDRAFGYLARHFCGPEEEEEREERERERESQASHCVSTRAPSHLLHG